MRKLDFEGDWRQQLRDLIDPLLEKGANRETVDFETSRVFGIQLGQGGQGPNPVPECKYCGAYGGGGHGGFCPNGG
jgi:hypothetical protein